jgi:hypothetical protein
MKIFEDGQLKTQPISATALPLPTGASTSANQSTIITSLASILTELEAKLESIDRDTDSISAGLATDVIMNDLTALTPKFAVISASSSGANAIVSAVTDKKIRVLGYNFISNGDVNAKWQSATTDKTGLKYLTQYTGLVAGFNPLGWFETASNEALNLNLSAAIAVGGEIVYIEV